MKILSNYFIQNNNYQISTQKQKPVTFCASTKQNGNTDSFEHIKKQEPEMALASNLSDEELDIITYRHSRIENIEMAGNIAIIENTGGESRDVYIPESYFKSVKDKHKQVKIWLADSIHNHYNEQIPFELMDAANTLDLYNDDMHLSQLNKYRNALAKGIKVIHYEKDPETQRATVNIEVDGKPCKFSIYAQNREEVCRSLEDYDNEKSLGSMIQNLNDTLHGKFIRNGNIEVFVPYILERTPDIKKDETLILNGNPTKDKTPQLYGTPETDDVYEPYKERLEEYAGRDIDPKEIKTIKYLSKPQKGFDNNKVKTAYSYYDRNSERLYLYLPSIHKMQVLIGSKYVQDFYDI